MHPKPVPPKPGQESVWDYPRPPAIERCHARLRVVFAGQTIADTTDGYRVLETSHPPVYYLPITEEFSQHLGPAGGGSFCEWKGAARYFDIRVGDLVAEKAAWGYDDPTARFAPIAGFVAIYPGKMDACYVDDERVTPQPGGFYGGWITSSVAGPFKGGPGSMGW
ncbi:hypothetical protein Pla123a_15640 [Posidoniimonas polymericola]|uniref:DUF427 domain-containing protein n=1 Tax=Posidoniimonas polymericola TaxID=2528002 RepID=A0A5C5YS94_9BACT|nr:DUF427 domain-containing protein [Posidoniimonas polymericola]TWT77768.1 hypothetical protein Pla123a_15640 [Posidoniimonas polymericola]